MSNIVKQFRDAYRFPSSPVANEKRLARRVQRNGGMSSHQAHQLSLLLMKYYFVGHVIGFSSEQCKEV